MRQEERTEPTPERLAKGGVRVHRDPDGNFLSTTAEPDTVLTRLIDRGAIPEHLADYANGFHELRLAFLSDVSARGPSYGQHSGKQTLGVSASRYLHIRHRKLDDRTADLCLNASTPDWEPSHDLPPATYRDAFERLAEAMNEAQREITSKTIAEDWAAILSGVRGRRL